MKTAIVTGGNSGIGKETAIALAKKDYSVIINGKDPIKTKDAVAEIKTRSGNNNIEGIAGDISTIKGVKEFTAAVKAKTNVIEALVLSTGIIVPNRITTADGFESMFAVQYFSRFATTQLLLQELKNGRAKIVHVGATKIKNAEIYFDDISLKDNFTMFRAMGQCMYANYLFVQEFAKRNANSGMVMNIGNVGIAKTDIARDSNFLFRLAVRLIGKSPEQASHNFTYLASDPAVDFSGYFLKNPSKPSLKTKVEYDEASAARLWDMSMESIK